MEQEILNERLKLHEEWLKREPGGEKLDLSGIDLNGMDLSFANLRGANLQNADLRDANLRYANLKNAILRYANLQYTDLEGANLDYADLCDADLYGADLQNANLQNTNLQGTDLEGTNLDFSCWPLWCGSFDVKVDKRIAAQLAYHFCRLDCDDPEFIETRNSIIGFANQFHRVEECGKLEAME